MSFERVFVQNAFPHADCITTNCRRNAPNLRIDISQKGGIWAYSTVSIIGNHKIVLVIILAPKATSAAFPEP